ncbi:MAG: hypothetical protein JW816_04530 [Candidatus Buchananbacteria bacterium]|nr:hypothetical protein [Candidatus Buchananbacteria bacterium]
MDIVIDFSQIGANPLANIWWFFRTIGWIYPVFLFGLGMAKYWQSLIRAEYRKKRKYLILAIDVPRNNEQTPKAVENIFNHLAGAHKPLRRIDKWWYGELPESFSFEIISIGGYIQFLVHLEQKFRDLVEAIIYAQYPDAEITEVEDYTKDWNIKFPNEKYNLWGAEVIPARSEYYPIRVYKEFEDTASKATYKDSMASLLESLTRIGPGEQIWVQFVVTPADNDWGDGAKKLVNKLIGAAPEEPKGLVTKINKFFAFIVDTIITPPESAGDKKSDPNKLMYLTEGEKDVVTAVERKAAKIGFHTRILVLYIAEKERFNKAMGGTIYGSFKQYNTNNLNSLKPNSKTSTVGMVYFKDRRLNARRNNLLHEYKSRGHWMEPGQYGFILNSEELATVYHFPTDIVKTPLLQQTQVKKGEPPISLPIENMVSKNTGPNFNSSTNADEQKAAPPINLPT